MGRGWGPRMGRLSAGWPGSTAAETLANTLNTGGLRVNSRHASWFTLRRNVKDATQYPGCVLVGLLRRMLSFYTFLISVLK